MKVHRFVFLSAKHMLICSILICIVLFSKGDEMAWNSSVVDKGSVMHSLAWDTTLHRVLSASLSVSGTVFNLTAIVVIVIRRLYKQNSFIFVLNFFVGNLLMCSLALPLHFSLSYSSLQKADVTCVVSGYVYFSLAGNSLLHIILISLNRYLQIVRFNHYKRIFSSRNTRIILVFAWLLNPAIYILPMTGVWGNFRFDSLRFICNPLISNDGFRQFAIVLATIITIPTISFCYIGIIQKTRSSGRRVNTTTSGSVQRLQNEKQLIRSVFVMITLSSILLIPFFVSFLVDPRMELIGPWFHCLAFYLGLSFCSVNTLTESILNQQLKTSFLSLLGRCFEGKRAETLAISDTGVNTTS